MRERKMVRLDSARNDSRVIRLPTVDDFGNYDSRRPLTDEERERLRRDFEELWPKMEAGMRYLKDR